MDSADQSIEFPADGSSLWAGMGDYRLLSPGRAHEVSLRYVGEPPFGDSYHETHIDGVPLPGFMWGCNFAFTADGRFFAGSWMAQLYERRTIIVDCASQRFFVLPLVITDFWFQWPIVKGAGGAQGLSYESTGREKWMLLKRK